MKIEFKDLPHLPNAVLINRNELRASDNTRHHWALRQLTYDGAPIHGKLDYRDKMPVMEISRDGKGIYVILFPEMERFILEYLQTGISGKYPKQLKNYEIPDDVYKGDDYVYRHLRRAVTRKGCEVY